MSVRLLVEVREAFKAFDASMDPILDEVQDRDLVAAVSMGLALRLVSYATGSQPKDAEPIAASLVRELATIKRQMSQ